MSPRPARVAVSIAPSERDALARVAHEASEPIATTAGRLLRAALADHGAQLDQPAARRTGPPRTGPGRRPAMIEAGDRIEALHVRYPADLRHVPSDLTTDNLMADMLGALAAWRDHLDTTDDLDPREILAFVREMVFAAATLQGRARRGR